ncbi:MAG: neutral/alkaline non-lysosomal ceramidase N-terminal domain-containing protein [Planctomycetaceae bacterium]|nr:neutral/alkaline non-lysosomal ceramidase N-terminal domain-containing protein [Planctomycetaceae bacterium]
MKQLIKWLVIVAVLVGQRLIVAATTQDTGAITTESTRPRFMVGVSKLEVTPNYPTILAGYGHRVGEHQRVEQRLFARALVIGDRDPVVQVLVDNCGVPKSVVDRVKTEIAATLHIPATHVVIASTHTHNAPALNDYAPVLWAERATESEIERATRYTNELSGWLVEVVDQACQKRRPATLEWGIGRAHFGGNRRLLVEQTWAGFGFQADGPVDHSLPMLVARDEDDKPLAIWTSYACHCTTIGGDNLIHGDWAGCAAEFLERDFPGCVALIGIGCGADVGPQPSGSIAAAQMHGEEIRQEVKRLLGTSLTPLTIGPRVQSKIISLPYAAIPDKQHWEGLTAKGGFEAVHARRQLQRLEQRQEVPIALEYEISTWSFGDALYCVFLPGEVSVDYAVRLKKELDWTRLWIQAWSNDVPCYIPSRRLLVEGGYEADFSMIYYDRPNRFHPDVEDGIVGTVRELLGPVAESTPQTSKPDFFHMSIPTTMQRQKWRVTLKADDPNKVNEILTRMRKFRSVAINGCVQLGDEVAPQDTWYDFTGGMRQRPYVRQQSLDHKLTWLSAPWDPVSKAPAEAGVEEDDAAYDYLVFTGGLGYRSQPLTAGFRLQVQPGGETLDFDLSRNAITWQSNSGELRLDYLPTWRSEEDSAGFFLLQTPRGIDKTKEYQIAVQSLGTASLRWFSVDPQEGAMALLDQLLQDLDRSVE